MQNLPIAWRLGCAMGLMLALIGAVIALALAQSQWVGASSRQLASSGLVQVTLARQAETQALQGASHLHALFLLRDREQRLPVYRMIDATSAAYREAMDALTAQQTDDAESQALMTAIASLRERYMEAYGETVDHVELDFDSARPLMLERTLPLLRQMIAALDTLATLQTRRAHDRLSEIDRVLEASRERIVLLGAAAALVALFSAVLITRSVSGPLTQMARVADSIAHGDMQAPLPAAGSDEIGTLVRAVDQMRVSLGEREERIAELAFRDSLTGLANRTLFGERLEQAVASAQRTGYPLSVLLLDLDRFRNVNDVLGHDVGDQLLAQVGQRMSTQLTRQSDTLARLGGDEFAVLLPTQDGDAAQAVALKLLRALEAPLTLNGQTVDIEGSFGIASFPVDAGDAQSLVARADSAMYVAKLARSGCARFTPEMERSAAHGLGLLSDLRRAIDDDELQLAFQPKVTLRGGPCRAAEVLLRWQHPVRGHVPPDQFIPFAERTGFIRMITAWVLRESVRQLAAWQAEGLDLTLNVNVSTRDLTQQDLPALVQEQLTRFGVAPERLCLEVTEGAIMDNPARALAALQALHAMGVKLSIDDFGTGYSSLAYLKKLPVDELKIDRSFVGDLDRDEDDAIIVRSTIDLAHNMGLRVVAEGVETEAVRARLVALDCDEAQGYFFCKPLPAGDFVRWLAADAQRAESGHALTA